MSVRRLRRTSRGVSWLELPVLRRLGVRAAIFLRPGGVSEAPCRGLNLGFNTEDAPSRVRRNRTAALRAAGFSRLRPVTGQQVHGRRVRVAGRADAGRGWQEQATAWPRTDGLLTATPGLPLAVGVADCLPVLLAAEGAAPVGAIHAGWRGIAQGILPAAVRKIRATWRVRPARLWAVIGPGIGPRSFVVRGEALTRLRRICPEAVIAPRAAASGYDLQLAARRQLEAAGVLPGRILVVADDTAAHPRRYFSHRRDQGRTGRSLAIIQRDRVTPEPTGRARIPKKPRRTP